MKFLGGLIRKEIKPLPNCWKTTISYKGNSRFINLLINNAITAAFVLCKKIKSIDLLDLKPIPSPIAKALATTMSRETNPEKMENFSPKISEFRKSKGTGDKDCPTNDVAGVLFLITKKTKNAPNEVSIATENSNRKSPLLGIMNLVLANITGIANTPFRRNSGPIGSYGKYSDIRLRVSTVPVLIENIANAAYTKVINKLLFQMIN